MRISWLIFVIVGCVGDHKKSAEETTPSVVIGGDTVCEPLAEEACMLPWPSDRYLVEAETQTGWNIA